MVAIKIVLPTMDIPTPHALAARQLPIDTPICQVSFHDGQEGREVIFRYERSVGALPRFILHLLRGVEVAEGRQRQVVLCREAMGERAVVQAPEGSELSKLGEGAVDEVLVCACQGGGEDEVNIPLPRREGDVEVPVYLAINVWCLQRPA